jgi:uncharacterized protein YjbJ (UPF0337 family)
VIDTQRPAIGDSSHNPHPRCACWRLSYSGDYGFRRLCLRTGVRRSADARRRHPFSSVSGREPADYGARFTSCGPQGFDQAQEVGTRTDPLHQTRKGETEKDSGPEVRHQGVVEDVQGKTKETVGTVTGRDDMVREGKAQQDKADAQQDAAKKEAEAESARSGAKAAEKRQEANQ